MNWHSIARADALSADAIGKHAGSKKQRCIIISHTVIGVGRGLLEGASSKEEVGPPALKKAPPPPKRMQKCENVPPLGLNFAGRRRDTSRSFYTDRAIPGGSNTDVLV